MTATAIVAGIEDDWYAAKLPVNQPADIAHVILDVTRSAGLNGKAMYIEGGRAWEVEDNIRRLEPQWMGEEPSRSLARGQELLGNVSFFLQGGERESVANGGFVGVGHEVDVEAEVGREVGEGNFWGMSFRIFGGCLSCMPCIWVL